MTRQPARSTGPLLDLRTFVIVASAVLVGVLVAASDGIGAALASALGAAAALHALVDRGRRDRRSGRAVRTARRRPAAGSLSASHPGTPICTTERGSRIRMFARRIAVVAPGYLGLTIGACLASLGHRVICADVDEAKVERPRAGEIGIPENG